MRKYLDRHNSKKFLLISTILFFIFILVILPRVADLTKELIGDHEGPDTTFMYDKNDIFHMAENYGEQGRLTYVKLRWTFDIIWPFVYLLFLLSSTLILTKNYKNKVIQSIYLVPILSFLFDIGENTFASILMLIYPRKIPLLALFASLFSFLKWIFISLSFLIISMLLLLTLIKWISTKFIPRN